MGIKSRTPGIIRDGTGFATFNVAFEALVFRPFKDEVLPATVDVVNKVQTCLLARYAHLILVQQLA